MLASVRGGNTDPIERLVEDPNVNEYVRDAGLRAILALVGDGQKDRAEVVDFYNPFLLEEISISQVQHKSPLTKIHRVEL